MRVGEIWKLTNSAYRYRSDAVYGDLVKITRIYYFDLDNQDYVEYNVIEDEDFIENDLGIGGGMSRINFLNAYERVVNES